MTAATVTTEYDSVPKAVEHVILTVSDGETFVSRLSNPEFCHITPAEDMGTATASPSYTISSNTVTIYADATTDKLMAVSVYGKK